ncbi:MULTISPECIES: hypothetical protein [unclassified Nocardioides]|uniref:hypothetical protein n=1 Tax=unclassified Nocardioides TaxID=2615069 RepID=UPI003014A41B
MPRAARENYDLRSCGEQSRRRNLSLILIPPTKELLILEDDQVMARKVGSTFTNGTATCNLSITTREASAHYVEMSRVRVTLFHD